MKINKTILALASTLLVATPSCAQNFSSIPEEILKGSNTQFRDFWDVRHYTINVEPDYESRSLKGSSFIKIKILKNVNKPTFQIDLQQPMTFVVVDKNKEFTVVREKDFIFLTSNRKYQKGEILNLEIKFEGQPKIAKNAPWDGGWVFNKSKQNQPWMSVAQEEIGASLWLPIKDIWSDEPEEGILMNITTPSHLVGVGNGRLITTKTQNDKKVWSWKVTQPINTYSIVPTIGKLVNFKDEYQGEKGKLDLDYWVLEENLDIAKKHFEQTKDMLKALEHWFGPYPFYEDSFKLVETPYLGMEHQSNIAYGNQYKNGYLGYDMSGSGYGRDWDYIIVHESGHEWFANNITAKDQADMWIHEGFTTYSEVLFVDYHKGKEAGNAYAIGLRRNIQNDRPVIGEYGKRNEGSGDMYAKGAATIHTIRQWVNNDEKFRQMLRKMNSEFRHQTVTTEDIVGFMNKELKLNLNPIVEQYFRTTKIPTLEYQQNGKQLKFRYQNVVSGFNLPLRTQDGISVQPTTEWKTIELKSDAPVEWDKNFYVRYTKVI